ncbi:MAG: hypothetical protein Q4G07_01030 [Oscillospiraceae bacterium]|nr:hypothetical protein [Oscillospiraceae bacterium]
MTISIINGSPKRGKSTSELMIKYFCREIGDEKIVRVYDAGKAPLQQKQYDEIMNSTALLMVFPLYVDSFPSNVLRILAELEKQGKQSKNMMVYCIVNNGFFEGKQNDIVIEQMKNWCEVTGATWGQGVGVGAGEMLPFLAEIPLGHGPNKNLGRTIKLLADNIRNQKSGENILVSPNWPRFLWRLQSSLLVWYPRAKHNGLKKRDLKKKY